MKDQFASCHTHTHTHCCVLYLNEEQVKLSLFFKSGKYERKLTAPGYETGEAIPKLASPAAAALLCKAVAETICALDILDIVCKAFSLAAWSC